MTKCVVSGCRNRMLNVPRAFFTRTPKRFFNFPKDPARVKVWLAALRETEKQDSSEQHVICEDHFLPEDISSDGVASDAIPIMPPYMDGLLNLGDLWGAESSEEEGAGLTGAEEDDDATDESQLLQIPAGLKTSDPLQPDDQSVKSRKVFRTEVSLKVLMQRFLRVLLEASGGSVDLGQVALRLKARKPRVYLIANVLDGIRLIERESVCRIRWIGRHPISSYLWKTKSRFQRELDHLKLVEATLDGLIKTCAQQLFVMTDDVKNSAAAYVTHDDVSRLHFLQDQTVIAVKSPEETKLEIPVPSEDSVQVHLKAGRGPITVLTCELGSRDIASSEPTKSSGAFVTLEESRIRTSPLYTGPPSSSEFCPYD